MCILLSMGKNWPALLFLGLIGVVYGVVGVPWANSFGRWWISVAFYAVLLLVAIYCRYNRQPIHSKGFHRKSHRSPQNL